MDPNQEKQIEAVNALAIHGTKAEAARSLGVPISTFKDRYASAVKAGLAGEEDQLKVEDGGETKTVTSVSTSVKTVEDALAKAEVDLDIWEVQEVVANSWPTAMKLKKQVVNGGNEYTEEEPHQVWNWQIKVKLKRRAPKSVQDAISGLLSDLYEKPINIPSVAYATYDEPHMLELSLFDAHFGKVCHSAVSGHDYNLAEATRVYENAANDLLAKCKGFNIEEILIPVGNDFFQADNWKGTTVAGTQVSMVESLYQEVFRSGCKAVHNLILLARQVAPVNVIWIPGNHDMSVSWYMTEYLRALFSGDTSVTIDNAPAPRKYIDYGTNLIGFTHGNEEKHRDLPLIMATEVSEVFSKTSCREFHIGHFHKAKRMDHLNLDEHVGVKVRVLPSLSGTDAWHFKKGYVKNVRAAEAYLWGLNDGLTGTFTSVVR